MTILFAFDRDYTVENPSPTMTGPIAVAHVRWLQEGTPHEVWAIGNQKLCLEAGIPGIAEMALRLNIPGKKIVKHFGDQFDRSTLTGMNMEQRKVEKRRINVECKRKRMKLLHKLFPNQAHYIVTDDYPEVAMAPWLYLTPDAFQDRWWEVQSLALGSGHTIVRGGANERGEDWGQQAKNLNTD